MNDPQELTSAIMQKFLGNHLPSELVERIMGFLTCEVDYCLMHSQENTRYCLFHHEECSECGTAMGTIEAYYCGADAYCENHIPRCEVCDQTFHDDFHCPCGMHEI